MYVYKVCVSRKCLGTILRISHDSCLGGRFGFPKRISRFSNFPWRHKSCVVKQYVHKCFVCQQFKDSNQNKLSDPIFLEMPEKS